MAKYVIDGYNLLFRLFPHATLKILTNKREELIRALGTVSKIFSWECSLLFDGTYGTNKELSRTHIGNIEVIYSPKGKSVDRVLLDADLDFFKGAQLVTSDEKLGRMMKLKGVKTLSSESFAKLIKKKLSGISPSIEQSETRKSKGGKSNLPPLSDTDSWTKLFEELNPKS